jgi:hypothetical protein
MRFPLEPDKLWNLVTIKAEEYSEQVVQEFIDALSESE